VPRDAVDGTDEVHSVEGAATVLPEGAVTVDVTVEEPAGKGLAEAMVLPEGARVIPTAAGDGDSTVDLTVDPADMAAIRAAQRDGSTGDGASVGLN